jgi:hypothetical protein
LVSNHSWHIQSPFLYQQGTTAGRYPWPDR